MTRDQRVLTTNDFDLMMTRIDSGDLVAKFHIRKREKGPSGRVRSCQLCGKGIKKSNPIVTVRDDEVEFCPVSYYVFHRDCWDDIRAPLLEKEVASKEIKTWMKLSEIDMKVSRG